MRNYGFLLVMLILGMFLMGLVREIEDFQR